VLLVLGESNRMRRAHANYSDAVPRALVTMLIRLRSLKINFFGIKSLELLSDSASMVEFNKSSKCEIVARKDQQYSRFDN